MNCPAYPKYKPSGVDWLGEVPEHWEVKRLKFIATVQTGVAKGKDYGGQPTIEMPYLRVANVQDGYLALEDMATIEIFEHEVPRYLLRPGDVLMNEGGDYDKLGRGHVWRNEITPCIHQNHVFAVRPHNVSSLWLNSVTGSVSAQFYFMTRAKQTTNLASISSHNIMELPVPLPPRLEQKAILAFLDRETGRIDTLVAKKRELITRLKERRAALITRAVTRGLDPAAKLKDSGVEWLGMVPEGWEVQRFSRVARVEEGQVDPEVEPYVDMILIAPNHVESGTGILLYKETAAEQAAESGKYRCRVGDVIYSKIRPALAKVAMAEEDCLCSADMYPIRGGHNLANKYLYWSMLSRWFIEWSTLESARVAMPKINRETLGACKIPLPPLAEQRAIADYLDRETGKLDRLTASVEAAIERLQEYRAALITAAVTGKIDVREANATEAA